MIDLLVSVVVIGGLLMMGNVAGWVSVRLSNRNYTWNWRVLFGPWWYYKWNDRRMYKNQ